MEPIVCYMHFVLLLFLYVSVSYYIYTYIHIYIYIYSVTRMVHDTNSSFGLVSHSYNICACEVKLRSSCLL